VPLGIPTPYGPERYRRGETGIPSYDAYNPFRIRSVENRTINNMIIIGGGPGVRALPAIVGRRRCKADVSSNRVGIVSSTVQGSLCQADIPGASSSRNRPRRQVPDPLRLVSTPANCSTVGSARAESKLRRCLRQCPLADIVSRAARPSRIVPRPAREAACREAMLIPPRK
jgi:hypothetical protein